MPQLDHRLGFPKVRIPGRKGLIELVPKNLTNELNRASLYWTDYGKVSALKRREFNFWWLFIHNIPTDSIQRYFKVTDKAVRKIHARIETKVRQDMYTSDFFERRNKAYLKQSITPILNQVNNLKGQGKANLKQAKLKEIDNMLDKYSGEDFTFPEAEMMPSDEEEKLDMIRRRLDYFEDPDNSYPERDNETEAAENDEDSEDDNA